jgi:PAS domain S-box-containing protein
MVLQALGAADDRPPLDFEHFPSPVYVLDRDAVVRWANPAARELFGELVGRTAFELVEPRFHTSLRGTFARMLLGTATHNDADVVFAGRHGRVRARINATPVRGARGVVGTFGVLQVEDVLQARDVPRPRLTPRQDAVLHLLAAGRSTEEIGDDLGLARATVRNHVQAVLRRLGARSRVEAVALARERGMLDD